MTCSPFFILIFISGFSGIGAAQFHRFGLEYGKVQPKMETLHVYFNETVYTTSGSRIRETINEKFDNPHYVRLNYQYEYSRNFLIGLSGGYHTVRAEATSQTTATWITVSRTFVMPTAELINLVNAYDFGLDLSSGLVLSYSEIDKNANSWSLGYQVGISVHYLYYPFMVKTTAGLERGYSDSVRYKKNGAEIISPISRTHVRPDWDNESVTLIVGYLF